MQIRQLHSDAEPSILTRKSTEFIALIIELKLIIADFLMLKTNVLDMIPVMSSTGLLTEHR